MRNYLFLVSFVFSCALFSAANSVTITQGRGELFDSGVYSFGFSGSGQLIPVPGALGEVEFMGGLVQCNPCDPLTTAMSLLVSSGITIVRGDRFVEGFLDFEPTSFVSSLKNRLLEVDYRATADIQLTACIGDPVECNPVGPIFYSNPSQVWYVQALFTPYNGQYLFQRARLSSSPLAPVPEPATLILLGTGFAALEKMRKVRRH